MSDENSDKTALPDRVQEALDAIKQMYRDNPLLREMKQYQNSRFTEDIEFELDVPSGKIVISADLSDFFNLDPETEKRESAWRLMMYERRTRDYAKDKSAWVSLYENYPKVILQSDGTLTFDRLLFPDDDFEDFETDEEEVSFYNAQLEEGETMLPYVPRGYQMHVADYDEWVSRGGDPDSAVTGEDLGDAEEYDVAVIEIPAGRYKFTSYSVNDDFWGPGQMPTDIENHRGRTCFAKMSLVEAY